jgi:hypothetical protein
MNKRANSIWKATSLFVIAAVLVALVAGLPPVPVRVAQAATINVAAGEVAIMDNNICSLREAIINANANAQTHDDCPAGSGASDTIMLAAGSTYTLTDFVDTNDGQNGLPSITSPITIQGNRATIRRDPSLSCSLDVSIATTEFRIFHVAIGGNLTLNQVTVSQGCADGPTFPAVWGGGILNRGTLTLTNSTFSTNAATTSGGGIFNHSSGTVTIMSSTLSGNSATNGGGIINNGGTATIQSSTLSMNSATNGGGIFNNGMVTISNSTLSGNSATSTGGGIRNDGGTATIQNSTLSGNSAPNGGGGIRNTLNSTINIKNSIVANSPSGGDCSNSDTFTATGDNLDTDGSCVAHDADFMQVTPAQLNLGPLALNAPGTTRTHALLSGSAAINAVSDCTDLTLNPVTTDQRGVMRPQAGMCDVGAFEALVQSPTFFTLQGNGVCLTLNLRTRQYILRTPRQTIAGIFSFRQSGQMIRFQSAYGDTNRLLGWINLRTRAASAVLTLPLGLGGQRFTINDLTISDNGPCL